LDGGALGIEINYAICLLDAGGHVVQVERCVAKQKPAVNARAAQRAAQSDGHIGTAGGENVGAEQLQNREVDTAGAIDLPAIVFAEADAAAGLERSVARGEMRAANVEARDIGVEDHRGGVGQNQIGSGDAGLK